ncbi:class I SAM-dependent methyltransferase [Trichothermofontia sp.]
MTESAGGETFREIFGQIHCDLPREIPGGAVYTEQALGYLPPLSQPQILDIGCGPGEQTLTLARLTDGQIMAIDTHQPYLDRLQAEANSRGWGDRIHCRQASMFDLSFVETPVDLIWSEGAIYLIGFTEGLQQWRSVLKPGGYLVVSELV